MGLIGDKLSRFKVKDVSSEKEIKYKPNQLPLDEESEWVSITENKI